jgi:hypothetical protein
MNKQPEVSLEKVIAIVVGIWILISLGPFFFGLEIEQRGQLGDMFGFTNSFFSSLAFALLVFTAYLQRKDIGLQREMLETQKEDLALTREELKLTREELNRTADAQEKSEEALRKQYEIQAATARISGLNTLLVNCMDILHQSTASEAAQKLYGNQKEALISQLQKQYEYLGIDIFTKLKQRENTKET